MSPHPGNLFITPFTISFKSTAFMANFQLSTNLIFQILIEYLKIKVKYNNAAGEI